MMAAITMAVLHVSPRPLPALADNAIISDDGMVVCAAKDSRGHSFFVTVDSIVRVRDNFRGLADHLKLSDTEREEMFDALRKWFIRDFRATSGDVDKEGKKL